MYNLQFGKATTLATLMSDSETSTATLSSSVFTNFINDFLVIDYDIPAKREVIKCTVTGTGISSITRAQEGTSAVEHAVGAKVAYNFVPSHYAGMNKFWASVFCTGVDLTSAGTSTLSYNQAYSVTKISGNTNGLSSTSSIRKIIGGFYFEAPRTGSYRLKVSGNNRCSGSTGPYGIWAYTTQDTSNPTQNADGTNDGGTIISTITTTVNGLGYIDTASVSGSKIINLTAGTTYYFTLQNRWESSAGTTPSAVQVGGDQGATQGLTLEIEELN